MRLSPTSARVATLGCAIAAVSCSLVVSTSGLTGNARGSDASAAFDGSREEASAADGAIGDALGAGDGRDATAFPLGRVLDDFNRADGPLGAGWTTVQGAGLGDFLVAASRARFSQGNNMGCGVGTVYMTRSFAASVEVYVTLLALPSYGQFALIGKQDDFENRGIVAEYDFSDHTVNVQAFPNLASFGKVSVTFTAGDRFGVRFLSDANVEVYKNEALTGIVSTIGAESSKPGRIGMWAGCASSPVVLTLDDFGGGDLP